MTLAIPMPLVTDNARRSFDAILERATQLRLKQRDEDHMVISASSAAAAEIPVALDPGLGPGPIVVTIASITFRLLLMLQIEETAATRRYFLGDDARRPFEDAVSELANLCGGVLNQELLRYFPDLGMSTPYRLDAQCLRYLEALAPQYLHRFSVVIETTEKEIISCIATLCVSANAPLDFAAEIDAKALDTGGELEFF